MIRVKGKRKGKDKYPKTQGFDPGLESTQFWTGRLVCAAND